MEAIAAHEDEHASVLFGRAACPLVLIGRFARLHLLHLKHLRRDHGKAGAIALDRHLILNESPLQLFFVHPLVPPMLLNRRVGIELVVFVDVRVKHAFGYGTVKLLVLLIVRTAHVRQSVVLDGLPARERDGMLLHLFLP